MSREAVVAFFEKSRTDKTIYQKFLSFGPEAPSVDVISLGRDSGYDFSEDDMIAVIKTEVEAGIAGREELSDYDLENVAGGVQNTGTINQNKPTQGEVKIRFPRCIDTNAAG